MTVVKLYGICHHTCEKILVATFDSRVLAENYIKKSRLKKPHLNEYGTFIKTFRNKSLLYDYESVLIEDPSIVPHNPD